jgi:hypothetical protein
VLETVAFRSRRRGRNRRATPKDPQVDKQTTYLLPVSQISDSSSPGQSAFGYAGQSTVRYTLCAGHFSISTAGCTFSRLPVAPAAGRNGVATEPCQSRRQNGICVRRARLYRFARDEEIDLEELRTRLRKMTDDLLRFGKAARFMWRDKVHCTSQKGTPDPSQSSSGRSEPLFIEHGSLGRHASPQESVSAPRRNVLLVRSWSLGNRL